MSAPAIEGWFTTGPDPTLTGERCTTCATVYFPPTIAAAGYCRHPACQGEEFERVPLSRRGRVWSYTDAQYPFEPFAIAAVELPEGIVVLGQVARGYGVDDLRVGAEAELVVEPEAVGDALVWKWLPLGSGHVTELGEEADQ